MSPEAWLRLEDPAPLLDAYAEAIGGVPDDLALEVGVLWDDAVQGAMQIGRPLGEEEVSWAAHYGHSETRSSSRTQFAYGGGVRRSMPRRPLSGLSCLRIRTTPAPETRCASPPQVSRSCEPEGHWVRLPGRTDPAPGGTGGRGPTPGGTM